MTANGTGRRGFPWLHPVAQIATGLVATFALVASVQAQSGDAEALLERIEPITQQVVDVRGLAADRPIPAGVHSRESLREVLVGELDSEYSPERFRVEARLFRHFGLLPEDMDYRQMMLDLLTAQIAGFYDDATGELFLIEDIDALTLEPTLAHEIFHGIQDQRFGIDQVRGEWPTADDALLAVSGLLEGDAVAVMLDYMLGGFMSITDIPGFMEMADSQIASFDPEETGVPYAIPEFILELLLFPYLDGLAFVHALKSEGGWAAVDAVYADPPRSTEQILHPERYRQRDEPTWVTFSADVEAGWEVTYDQVLGELQTRALLRRLGDEVSERAVDNAAAGWDGDRIHVWERGDDPDAFVVAWLSVWDTPDDARAFAALLTRFIGHRRGEALERVAEGEHGSRHRDSGAAETGAIVERWGDMVLYLGGIPAYGSAEAEVSAWRESVWRSRVRTHYEPR